MAAYSTVDDLLLGDIPISSKVDKEKFVDAAAEEIDSRIGHIYALPLTGLASHSQLLLKRINNHLATGRLILAVDAGGDDALHAYGLSLINGALGELAAIANGMIDLVGADRVPGTAELTGPAIVNADAYSATEAFEQFAFNGQLATWRPGP